MDQASDRSFTLIHFYLKNSIMFYLHTRFIRKQFSLPAIKLALVALLAFCAGNAYAQGDELLPSDEAYAFDVSVTDGGFDARWTIADDYYMYRDKLSFSLTDSAGNPIELAYDFPKSKKKSDPIFGDVEVYFHQANFMIPTGAASGDVVLTVKGQGCNEPVGVCYPPIKHEIPLSLISSIAAQTSIAPQMNATPGEAQELNSIDELRDLLGGASNGDEELLPPDEAFKVSAITDRDNLVVRFDVADGYYLYQSKLKFNSSTHSLTEAVLPEGELKQDEYFGEQIVYKHQFDALLKPVGAGSGEMLVLETEYQGCADLGVCYPPQKKTFELSVADLISSASAQQSDLEDPASEAALTALAAGAVTNEKSTGKSDALWWILLTAFVAGVGLTFTPCVLPLIPILSGVIGGQGPDITKAKAAWLASIYVLGTAATYAAIGAVAGATGDQLQAYFQNAWAIGIMSSIFVIMALSMFGLFEIQMPSFLQSKLATSSQGIKGGSTVMVFILGLISALIVGACVSPVLISFLSLAIAKGSPVLGALTMFSMAMGMGIPLILIGMGAGHLIPKAGMWMDKVKYVFGVMLIAVAVYLLSVLPAVPVLYFWAALFIVVAVYMGATQSLPEGASGWTTLFKGLGTLLLIWGVLALVGAIYGQRDILKPLPERLFSAAPQIVAATGGVSAMELSEHPFERVNNIEELDQRMAEAVKSGKNVMIDYYADWCVECLKMEKSTFKDRAVREELASRYVALQVDVTDPKDEARKLLKKRYGVFGPPAALFFDSNGTLMQDKNFYGFMKADKFLALLRSI